MIHLILFLIFLAVLIGWGIRVFGGVGPFLIAIFLVILFIAFFPWSLIPAFLILMIGNDKK